MTRPQLTVADAEIALRTAHREQVGFYDATKDLIEAVRHEERERAKKVVADILRPSSV